MKSIENLEKEINTIKERNKKVEADKAWETSASRKILIFILTYIVIVIFFVSAKLPKPLLNSLVPAIGFMISTLTIPVVKKWWLAKRLKR
jgi:hypothetical protein